MNKKEYLTRLLDSIQSIWEPARWFMKVLKVWGLDDGIVDQLIKIIEESIKETKNESKKKKLEWSVAVLEKIKSMEQTSNKEDETDCEELLDKLEML